MQSQHAHPYNPAGVIAYFISFRCYGTWLHGDERGSMDRSRNHAFGAPAIAPDPGRTRYEHSVSSYPPMTLDGKMRETVEQTIREVCLFRGWHLHAANAQKDHVHTVTTANGAQPEKVLNDFKAWCTRRLREATSLTLGLPQDNPLADARATAWSTPRESPSIPAGSLQPHDREVPQSRGGNADGLARPIWSRHGSTIWLWTEAQLANAVLYALAGQGEPPSTYREPPPDPR